MSTSGKSADVLVDEFVRYLNGAGFEPKFPKDLPEELRKSSAEYGMFHWEIRPATCNAWVEKLVQQLPQMPPRPLRSLIGRHRFCNFEVGPLMLFANCGHDLSYELSTKIFNDEGLFPTLHKNGYLRIGNPHEANYDPVWCFDVRHRNRDDAPIVRIDHEDILIRSRIWVVENIAESFTGFMQRAIEEKFSVH